MTAANARPGAASPWSGWRLTALLAVALLAMTAGVLLALGTGEQGVRALIRATARSSALLFVLVYLARPLQALRPGPLSRFALRERRYLGVAVAISHAIHLAAIVALARGWPEAFAGGVDASTIGVGGLGFVLLFAMAATSSDAAVRRLGRARWRVLHRSGLHLLWAIFLITFAGNLAISRAYAVPVAILLLAAVVRAAAFLRRRRPAAATA
jgi:DMSO/TMAO reductase YedYZ heme-binding membrane subunit